MTAAGLCGAALCASAHALERVTLRTGFSYDCTRQEPVDESHVRLFLVSGDAGQSINYIDLSRDAIASVEVLPDPPKPPAPPPIAAPTAPDTFSELDIPTLLNQAGKQHRIDVDLLAAVMHTESGGNVKAVSRVGAQGLMQLMPATARDLGVQDAFRADQNINGGTTYLEYLLDRFDPKDDRHGLDLALAAYNAGPAAVESYHNQVPPYRETQNYVNRVEREFKRRKDELKRHPLVTTAAPTITMASR